MPIRVDPYNTAGRANRSYTGDLERAHYDYDYPEGLDLKPGTELHDRLRDMLWVKAWESHQVMSRRHGQWREIDKKLRAYVEPEAKKKNGRGYDEKSVMPKIIMPVSYATLETLLTYMSTAFLQSPIFRYEGQGPEDMFGAQLLQMVIDHQCRTNGVGLKLHTMWQDSFKYGVGAVHIRWKRDFGQRVVVEREGFLDRVRNLFMVQRETKKELEYDLVYEGNDLENIDPYRMLPDPNVPASDVQKGEFFGWVETTNYMRLLKAERDEESMFFNCKYLQHLSSGYSAVGRLNSTLGDRPELEQITTTAKPIDVIWMYVDLIPAEWGLGKGKNPEKWVFALAADQIVLVAEPMNLIHNMFPIAACAPDSDGRSIAPVGRMGLIHDIQDLVDFLFTSHVMNVRKAVNDMFVVDPYLVNIFDLVDPEPGGIVRLRRAAWGKAGAVKDAIFQVPVQDVTQGHVADAEYLMSFVQQVTGATDQVQGVLQHRGPRISSAQAQGAMRSSLSRLEHTARIISMQAHMPIARIMASHVQQLMERETYVKVTGEMEQRMAADYGIDVQNNRVLANPLDLVANYDLIEHDGTVPGSEDVSTMVELFQIMAQNPVVGMHFDIPRIVKHIFRHMGAKNVDDFVLKTPSVVPDEQVEQQVQAGNLVPMSGDGMA